MKLQNKRILVVVAHPDDEILGVGGSINQLVTEHNCYVRIVILGEGLTSRSDQRDTEKWQQELEIHRANIKAAQKILGYQELSIHNIADNRFDSVDLLDIVKIVEKEKNLFKPEIILTHHYGDLNIDHQRTFEAVITATRPLKEELVKTIITFETPSATEWNYKPKTDFIPNFWLEINEQNLKAKQDAMDCYEFESRDFPHPRSKKALKVLAQKRGMDVGLELAEAFCIIRHVI
ncbi:MAG: PIG-L family deacetylase [Bacteroidales bacterium]|nr:PIG-L family deacetylase [Bacteroidales bacterium]